MTKQFLKEDGLQVQKEQLEGWKPKLSPSLYSDLLAYTHEENAKLTDESTGYDVCRGTDLDQFIGNWKPVTE